MLEEEKLNWTWVEERHFNCDSAVVSVADLLKENDLFSFGIHFQSFTSFKMDPIPGISDPYRDVLCDGYQEHYIMQLQLQGGAAYLPEV